MESEAHHKSQSGTTLTVTFIVLLIAVGAGAYYYGQKSIPSSSAMMIQGQRSGNYSPRPSGGRPGGGTGMLMAPTSPPPLSDQQTAQLTEGVSGKVTDKTFNITGGNFYFVPNRITVNKGDKVTFVMTNAGGVHDFVIDELNIKTPVIKTAEAATVSFAADKVGTFTYYCSVPGHKDKGMLGTLTVQ